MYLLQGRDFACSIYALCNALRFYGKPSPEPGMNEWEYLLDIAACRHGAAIHVAAVARLLGLKMEQIEVERVVEEAPAVLTVMNPRPGSSLHAALVIGGGGGFVRLVNYRTVVGPVVENIAFKDIQMHVAGNPNRRAEAIRLVR